jgi:class 3 adenylate cyclase/tetratricopeptide (TPR) repeat protein
MLDFAAPVEKASGRARSIVRTINMDIGEWLRSLGLERYEPAFRGNEIDARVLPKLTADDLRELGISAIGHRRMLLEAITTLRTDLEPGPNHIPPAPPATSNVVATAPIGDAERRQLSVMFCDMVGSTELATRLDPEELQEVMAQYHARVATAVTNFGGFVARYMGDGVLVYFGWPAADESDTERAVRAGLAVINTAGSVLLDNEPLQVRVGIATGLVVVGGVVGTGAAHEHEVVGETPNLAFRLQTLAEPGTLVISEFTHDQIAGLFDCEDLGAVAIKGFDRPITVWRVLRERAVRSRFEALHTAALTPLIGRDEELNILIRRWQQVKQGEGRVALISGEPGIGKSRLVAALMERLPDEDYTCVRYFCSPHHRASALHPIISQIEHAAGFGRDDPLEDKFRKLEIALAPTHPSEEELSLLAQLVSLPIEGRLPTLGYSPQRTKEKTLDALCHRLERLAIVRPTLIILEDAHWADPTTRELLDLTVDRLRSHPILLVMTFRTEFAAPWIGQIGVTLITLNRLGRRDAAAIATRIDSSSTLPRELLDWIVNQSDGVPLFIEELTMSVVEDRLAAPEGAPVRTVPRTLQGSLMARLDRLASAKQVAQVGAVIGREFSYELLAAVASMREPTLREGLDHLVASGLLFGRGRPPAARYRFKHALVQDAAYESLLRRSRRAIHAAIVEAVKQLVPEAELIEPELLGHHCAQAGLAEQAADYYRRAGEQSITRSAIAEARAHLERGLALARSIPESLARYAQEAGLLLALGSVAIIGEGYGAPGLATSLARAVALSRQADQRQLLVRALFGEWTYRVHAGDHATAQTIAREMVELAELEDDAIVRIVAATSLGISYAYAGRLIEARDLFLKCLAEPNIGAAAGLGSPHPQDHEVLARTYLARVLACLGESSEAADEAYKAIDRARELRHYPSLAVALMMGCRQAWLLRDPVLVGQRATELIALSEQQGFPYWLARGRCYAGWVAIMEGRVEDGLALLTEAASHLDTTDVAMGHVAALVGDAYARAGHLSTALQYIEDALRVSAKTGEVWLDAELYRLKGVVLGAGAATNAKSAEMHLLRALDIARSQGAKLWELRAAISLARLWSRYRKFSEALELLTPLRGRFGEAGSTPDLTEAAMLIGELVDAAPRA